MGFIKENYNNAADLVNMLCSRKSKSVKGLIINILVIMISTAYVLFRTNLPPVLQVLIIFALCSLYSIYWYIANVKISFDLSKICILIALPSGEKQEDSEILDKLEKKITQKIKSEDVQELFDLKTYPYHCPKNKLDARNKLKKLGIQMLIWIQYETGKKDGKKIFIPEFNYTYEKVPHLNPNTVNQLVSSAFDRKDWSIRIDDDIIDLETVSRNVKELATYILAITFLSKMDFVKARTLLNEIISNSSNQILKDMTNDLFVESIAFEIVLDYHIIGNKFGLANISLSDINRLEKNLARLGTYKKGVAYYGLAMVIYFLKGRISESIRMGNEAKKLFNSPIFNLNLGFIYMFQGRKLDAIKRYKAAFNQRIDLETVVDSIWFVKQFIHKSKHLKESIRLTEQYIAKNQK